MSAPNYSQLRWRSAWKRHRGLEVATRRSYLRHEWDLL